MTGVWTYYSPYRNFLFTSKNEFTNIISIKSNSISAFITTPTVFKAQTSTLALTPTLISTINSIDKLY